MKSRLFFCILITSICIQCKYSPTGDNYNEIREPADIQTQISIQELESDTVNLHHNKFVNYEIQPEGSRFIEAHVYLAGELIHENPNLSGGFWIPQEDLPNGLHELEVRAHFSSGTGSLADTLNLERIVAGRGWVLRVDKDPPTKVNITNAEEVDAGLLIEWEKYDRYNFKSYTIIKRIHNNYDLFDSFEIKDPGITSIVDSSYRGETVDLYVFLNTSTGNTEGDTYTYISENRTQFYEPDINNDKLTLSWTKVPNETGFDRYVLYMKSADDDFFAGREIEYFYNVRDTVFSFEHAPFGKDIKFRIEAHFSGPSNTSTTDTLSFSGGEDFATIDPQDAFTYSQKLDKYLVFKESSIEVLSTANGSVENVFDIQSPRRTKDGIFGLANVRGELSFGKYNALTFALERSVPLSAIFNKNIDIHYFEAASNSPIAVLGSDSLYVVNYETQQVLARHALSINNPEVKISSQGNLILINEDLYSINSGFLELVRPSNRYIKTFFPSGGSDRYYEIESSNVSVVKEFEGTNRNHITKNIYKGTLLKRYIYDKFQNTLIGVSSSIRHGHYFYRTHLFLFDEQREISQAIIDPYSYYFYTNDYLFSAAGYRKKID